jgi:UDP-N-acetylmuramate: L-alanyl-gamma-D-glutamyl-meso-diaminopimelate ligase
MAALAAMLQELGIRVTGSDQAVYPPMSDFLAQRGIPVREGFGPRNLDPDVGLVVIGNAMSRGNPEVEAVLDSGVPYASMPEMVKWWFLQGKRCLVVTGTHGKTTTSALLAWILHCAGRDPGMLVGGIPADFGSGFRLGSGPDFVIEGDEYDTAFFDKRPKFVHYLPRIVTLGALEFDHADIYRDMGEIMGAFRGLMRILPRGGRLIIHEGDANARALAAEALCPVITCGLERDAQWRAEGIRVEHGRTLFRVIHEGEAAAECAWSLAGRHNVLNALLAMAAAHEAGVAVQEAAGAVGTFHGVRRRLERLGQAGGVTLYDDFAHHPTAIQASLEALRSHHPAARIWAVLEPRSNSLCRNVFQAALPRALEGADGVILASVHRAERLAPDQRLDPQAVVMDLRARGRQARYLPCLEELVSFLASQCAAGDVVCIMSNGGFGGIQGRLMEALGGASGSRKTDSGVVSS